MGAYKLEKPGDKWKREKVWKNQGILSKLGIAYSMYFFVNGLDDTARGEDWDS